MFKKLTEMKQQIIGTKINKKLAQVLGCQVYGKINQKIKAKTLFSYKGFIFFTAKDGKYWLAYEFKSGMLSTSFADSEKSAIEETKRKIDMFCKTRVALYRLVKSMTDKEGYANHAKYSNLIPKQIHTLN